MFTVGTVDDVTPVGSRDLCVCVFVCWFRCSTHHASSRRSEGGQQRYRDVQLPRDREPTAGRLLPAGRRPANHDEAPARPILGRLDRSRLSATHQPRQGPPRRRSHRVCGRERPRWPGNCLGNPTSLCRGTRYVITITLSTVAYFWNVRKGGLEGLGTEVPSGEVGTPVGGLVGRSFPEAEAFLLTNA